MKIAVAKEIDPSEPRVAASPDTVKKYRALGVDIAVEPGAGVKSGLPDSEFTAAGATVSADALKDADIVIKVKRPEASELASYKRGALVIAIMDPYGNDAASAAQPAMDQTRKMYMPSTMATTPMVPYFTRAMKPS